MFEALRATVRDIDSVIDSAIVFIEELSDKLMLALTAGDTDAEVQKIIDDLNEHKAKLATAIAANTQAENDSDNADNGPTDDSAVAPEDGEPAVDPSQEPEGGEPESENDPENADDTSTSEQPVAGAEADDSVDSGNSDAAGVDTGTAADPSGASDDSGIASDGTLTVPVDETNLGDDASANAGVEEAAGESGSGTSDGPAAAGEQDESDQVA